MNSFRLIVFLGIILLLVILYRQATKSAQTTPHVFQTDTVSSETPTLSPYKEKQIIAPSNSEDTKINNDEKENFSDFVYPNAKITSTSDTILTAESNADTVSITAWYKQTIEEQGYATKTYIQSNTNGVIQNKLSASSDKKQINVTIEKDTEDKTTKITIIIKTNFE